MTETKFKSGLSTEYILRKSLCRLPQECSPAELAEFPNAHDWRRADNKYKAAVSELESLDWAEGYADGQGCTDPLAGILFANWNHFPKEAMDLLERAGYECEWSDEWTKCDGCYKALKTTPDCYGWQPAYTESDCETFCFACTDWEEYLTALEDNPRKACFAACDPAKYGYVQVSEPGQYENGFHVGMNDDPAKIMAELHKTGVKQIVFRIPETSQFYITFEVWRKVQVWEAWLEYEPRWDRFDICQAWHLYGQDFHNGQGSKEYAIFGRLKRMQYATRAWDIESADENVQAIYARLASGKSKVREG